jgi:threonine dehydrogenase-like Zn-dependent dehydrogenase
VIGIDRIPERLAVAQSHGILALNAQDTVDIVSQVAEWTGGHGPHIIVEATGSPAVVPLALDMIARGGRVVLLGSTRGRVELDMYSTVHRKGVQIIGAHESVQDLDLVPGVRWSKMSNLELLARLLAMREVQTEGLITHTVTPHEVPALYEALARDPGKHLGILIDWRQDMPGEQG